jgi:stearoyl-CoA desaturase (delta-9 desaturase)
MKIFSASASSITKIQAVSGILAILGIFYFDFTVTNLFISLISFYIYSILGVSLTLHRYYSHKSFEFKWTWLKWVCTFISILSGRGSVLGWVYVHRLHHAYSDTDKDPHSPHNLGFKIFGFRHIEDHSVKMKIFLVKELMTKIHIFINNYYFAIILAWLILLGFINFDLVYFTWVLPIMLVQISQNCFNYFAHKHGHRNFITKDTSTNNIYLWPFILGDAWHNNHHANAAKYNTQFLKWEFDPVSKFIDIIKR